MILTRILYIMTSAHSPMTPVPIGTSRGQDLTKDFDSLRLDVLTVTFLFTLVCVHFFTRSVSPALIWFIHSYLCASLLLCTSAIRLRSSAHLCARLFSVAGMFIFVHFHSLSFVLIYTLNQQAFFYASILPTTPSALVCARSHLFVVAGTRLCSFVLASTRSCSLGLICSRPRLYVLASTRLCSPAHCCQFSLVLAHSYWFLLVLIGSHLFALVLIGYVFVLVRIHSCSFVFHVYRIIYSCS